MTFLFLSNQQIVQTRLENIATSRGEYSRVIGLMAGTSLDGIDAACIEIDEPDGAVRLLGFVSQPYSDEWRARLLSLCENGRIEDATRAHFALGELFAEAALTVLTQCNLAPRDVLCIGSHGQTIAHLSPRETDDAEASTRSVQIENCGATLQIGAPAVIAERTGIAVISDFRARDIAAGGQGAPLVPFADFRLLQSKAHNRIAQNIGGIANLTWLPRGGDLESVRAWDSGPGNMVMDECAHIFSRGALQMDENGALAAQGKADETWLAQEMTHPFFAAPPPKSTGREEFGRAFALRFYQIGQARGLSPHDIIATATALCARSIAESYRALLKRGDSCQVIIGGGGARNPTLLEFLQRDLHDLFGDGISLHTMDEFGISSDAKEAVAFALLAHATMRGVPSNVPSATGARCSVMLGSITPANGER